MTESFKVAPVGDTFQLLLSLLILLVIPAFSAFRQFDKTFDFDVQKSSSSHTIADVRRSLAVEEEEASDLNEKSGIDEVLSEEDITKNKHFKVCDVSGALAVASLRSSEARGLFRGALEDAELAAEYLSEATLNGARVNSDVLGTMARSLDAEARNLTHNASITDTVSAGIAYADDRIDRRIDRFCSLAGSPFVGDKASDAQMMDAVSDILPWLVDRRTYESHWLNEHQNGWTSDSEESLPFPKLYNAGYLMSWGNCVWTYPPLQKMNRHPLTFGDPTKYGQYFNGQQLFVDVGLLTRDGTKSPFFYGPYTDSFDSTTSMITAIAFFDYNGHFGNHTYSFDDVHIPYTLPEEMAENRESVFIAHVGFDISLTTVSQIFLDLEDTMAEGSFAFLVNTESFKAISVSQSVVEKIYPERTGMEEDRNKDVFSEEAAQDRRNQTYTIKDTIHQSLVDLKSADWASLHQDVLNTPRGEHEYKIMNITLTKTDVAVPYYVLWDRWAYVEDWVLLMAMPVNSVDGAINVSLSEEKAQIVVDRDEITSTEQSITITNSGTLDVVVRCRGFPSWFELLQTDGRKETVDLLFSSQGYKLPTGGSFVVDYVVHSTDMDLGTSSSVVSFNVEDDSYHDCVHSEDLRYEVSMVVTREEDMNHISVVPLGHTFMTIALLLSLYFAGWVFFNRTERIVRASQPIFLIAICVGTFVMSSTILPIGIDDKHFSVEGCDIACMATPWLFCSGFTIAFSALFSKISRTNKVFTGAIKFRKIRVKEKDVLKPFAVLFALNFVVLLLWTVGDPLRWTRQPIEGGQTWETYGSCRSSGSIATVCLILLVLITLSALVLACVEAYKARNISDEFSESKFVAIAIICWLQVLLVGLPLLFLVHGNPTATYFLKVALIFVVSQSLLLLMFIPKMLQQKQKKEVTTTRCSSYWSNCVSFDASQIAHDPSGSLGMDMKSRKLEVQELRRRVRELEQLLQETGSGTKSSEAVSSETAVSLGSVSSQAMTVIFEDEDGEESTSAHASERAMEDLQVTKTGLT